MQALINNESTYIGYDYQHPCNSTMSHETGWMEEKSRTNRKLGTCTVIVDDVMQFSSGGEFTLERRTPDMYYYAVRYGITKRKGGYKLAKIAEWCIKNGEEPCEYWGYKRIDYFCI
jgi:hypothetical protein